MKNYRPIAIISVICKLCMLMVRERINEWSEDSGFLGDVQGRVASVKGDVHRITGSWWRG